MKGHDVSARKELVRRDEAEAVPGPVRRGRPGPPKQIHPDACPQSRHVRADGPEFHDAEGFSLEIALDRARDVHILRM